MLSISSLLDLAWATSTSSDKPLHREDSTSTVDEVCSAYGSVDTDDAKEDVAEIRGEIGSDEDVSCKPDVVPEDRGKIGTNRYVDDVVSKAEQLSSRLHEQLEQLGPSQLVAAWAKIYENLAVCTHAQSPSPFLSSRPPPIGIRDYFERISNFYQCSSACLIIGPVYIDRLLKFHPGFEINKLNIHRLLATSVMLAVKYNDDVFYSNSYYAKVAGMTVKEINYLEATFLRMIKWELRVSPEEFDKYIIAVHPAMA
jgi:hypothetical protein